MNNSGGTIYRVIIAESTSDDETVEVHSKTGMLMHLSWVSQWNSVN